MADDEDVSALRSALARMEREKKQLQEKLAGESNKRKEFEKKLTELQKSQKDSQTSIRKKDAEIKKLQSQSNSLESRLKALQQKKAASKGARIAGGDPSLVGSHSDEEVNELREKLAEIQSKISEFESERDSINDEIAAQDSEISEVNSSAEGGSSSGGKKGSSEEYEQLENQLKDLEAQIESCESSQSSLREKLKTQKESLTSKENEYNSLSSQVEKLKSEVSETAENAQEKLMERLEKQTGGKKKELKDNERQQNEKVEKLRDQLEEKKTKNSQLSESLQKVKTDHSEALESKKKEEQNNDRIIRESKEALDSVGKLKDEIKSLDDTLTEKKTEVGGLQDDIEKATKRLEDLYGRYREEQKRRKEFQFKYEDAKGKIRVYSRVRPFTRKEREDKEEYLLRPGKNDWTIDLHEKETDVFGNKKDWWREYSFDHAFHFGFGMAKGNGTQAEIFEECKDFAELTVQGINTCIFAYGQSGTGKTFTMRGVPPTEENGFSKDLNGLKPRFIERMFEIKKELRLTHEVKISCYMVEIYLNQLEDVMWKIEVEKKYKGKPKKEWPAPPELKLRVDEKKRVTIDNIVIRDFDDVETMMETVDSAENARRSRRTGLNENSSRSHLIFSMLIETTDKTGKKARGKISLVDLAGSERADKTNVEGLSKKERENMLEEGIAINESLRMLKNIFRVLGTLNQPLKKGQKAEVVQYRGNMLTEVMQDSLGGSAKTLMFVNVGPAISNIEETKDSFQYADYVQNITNEKAGPDFDYTEQIRRLREEIRKFEDQHGVVFPDEE